VRRCGRRRRFDAPAAEQCDPHADAHADSHSNSDSDAAWGLQHDRVSAFERREHG
jgi:hypothetical protein